MIVPPNNKAFLDIKLVQESMDVHAKRISMAYLRWVDENQYYKNNGGWYCGQENNPFPLTDKQLYNKFIESININNQHV